MPLTKVGQKTGKEFYQDLYHHDLQDQAQWLRLCAYEKVNSIEDLLKRNHIRPKTLLELGCGTGAVIMECQRRNLAERYIAVDASHEAIEYMRRNCRGIKTIEADVTANDFFAEACDVMVLSHVLEHLERPAEFLRLVQRIPCSRMVIEVPLEDLLGGRIKALFSDRTCNTSGHVQFYSARSFKRLLMSKGFIIDDARTYIPRSDLRTIELVCKMNGWGLLRRLQMVLASFVIVPLLGPLWSRMYYAHCAVLCRCINRLDALGSGYDAGS